MKPRHLRHILSAQTVLVAVLPFTLLTVLAATWLLPKFKANTQLHQIHLSKMTAAQVENHLMEPLALLKGISHLIQACDDEENYQKIVRSQINALPALQTLYIIDRKGHVVSVALKGSHAEQEVDLINLDMSGSTLFKKVLSRKAPVWSDTFLSVVGGGISVALAVPAGSVFVMGEIDLGALTQYLKEINSIGSQQIMVLDRKGQVIADKNGIYTAQQLNLSNLDIVEKGLNRVEPVIENFTFNDTLMTGCLVKSSLIDWSILIAIPEKIALRPVQTTGLLLMLILVGTILVGMSASLILGRRLADRFESLARHTRMIARGEVFEKWPEFSTVEFRDLTEDVRKMAAAIQEREEYNRVLFSSSSVPKLIIDPVTTRVVDGNQAASNIFGADSIDEITGKTVHELSRPKDPENKEAISKLADHFNKCMEQGITSLEWQFLKMDEEPWFAEIGISIFHHNEKPLFQMNIKDITLQKKEEKRRRKLEEQLRQAQKMESIGTLAGGIAHDFNNILFPVMGFAEMALEDAEENSSLKLALKEILKGCVRAKNLVEQILTFSRQTEREFKPLKMSLILKEILKLSRATLPSTIQIESKISKDSGMVLADPTQIHQVVMNLVTNAFHAMEETGGTLSVELNDVQLSSDNLPGSELIPGWYVCLTVSDTGCGIPPEVMEMIFDPYFTTKSKGKGTGLGLSVVHGIVKSYKGEIIIESVKGQGSTFRIYLPRAVKETALEKELPAALTSPGEGHVLLVDDEPQICIMIEQMLQRLGYQVTSFTDSRNAVDAYLDTPNAYDLVITDMTMPHITGDNLARSIKKVRPEIPIILCTGFSEKLENKADNNKLVDVLLLKPVLKADLIRAIDAAFKNKKERKF